MNAYQAVKRWLLLTFARELAVASDIIETVDLPVKMTLSHLLPIKPGTSKAELIQLLDDAILRRDIAPGRVSNSSYQPTDGQQSRGILLGAVL